nr:retinoblastoma-related protein [Tanacetum cinerariifolium]
MGIHNLKSKLLSPDLKSTFDSLTRPHPSGIGETFTETTVNLFFSKLAAVRIKNGVDETMQLSQQIRERVYMFFQQILSHRTALFFNCKDFPTELNL